MADPRALPMDQRASADDGLPANRIRGNLDSFRGLRGFSTKVMDFAPESRSSSEIPYMEFGL